MTQPSSKSRNNSFQSRSPQLLLLVVFVAGIVTGNWWAHRHQNESKGPLHGRIVNSLDLLDRNTVHIDKDGRPIRKKQFIEPFDIPNLSGFSVAELDPGQTVSDHKHESMHEIFYIISGAGLFTIDGKETQVSPGFMVHLTPKEKHQIVAQESADGSPLVMAYFGVTL